MSPVPPSTTSSRRARSGQADEKARLGQPRPYVVFQHQSGRYPELEGRQRRERVVLGKAHSEAVREIERKEGEAYRSGMEGSEERAWRAARTKRALHRVQPSYRSVLEALGVGGEDGASTGARRRAGLREDEAGRGEGRRVAGLRPQPLSGSARFP